MSKKKFELDGCRIAQDVESLTVQRLASGNIGFTADSGEETTSAVFHLGKVFELYAYLGRIIGIESRSPDKGLVDALEEIVRIAEQQTFDDTMNNPCGAHDTMTELDSIASEALAKHKG